MSTVVVEPPPKRSRHDPWYYLAIDVEAAGQSLALHHLIQLGAAVIDGRNTKLKERWSSYVAEQPNKAWEERCVVEFWNLHPKQFSRAKIEMAKAPNIEDVGVAFRAWLTVIFAKYGENNITIVFDTSGYDYARAELLMGVQSMMYPGGISKQSYARDFNSFCLGVAQVPPCLKPPSCKGAVAAALNFSWPKWDVEHNHNAADDAAVIGLNFAYLSNILLVRAEAAAAAAAA